jgi:flagellin
MEDAGIHTIGVRLATSDEVIGTFTVGNIVATATATTGVIVMDVGSMLFGVDYTTTGTTTTFSFKVGTGNETYDSLSFTVNAASATALSITGEDITSAANAENASTAVSAAIDTLNTSRSDVGAAQNRLSFAAQNLATAIENAEAARSTLLDLDVAREISVFTSKQVLLQTGIAMLAQANQLPQNLLRLFQ